MKHLFLLSFLSLFFSLNLFAQNYQNANYRMSAWAYQGFGDFGSGVSFVDFNGDGFDDISIATAMGSPPLFYENNNGFFFPIALASSVTCFSKHIIWIDYDNDGDRDLFISCEEGTNRLFNNDGALNLTDVTVSAGLPMIMDPTFGASFGDYDNDGWLDIYWVNRSFGGAATNYGNFLYKNMGDGTFQDVTSSTGTMDYGKGPLCTAFMDYNQDGWQDIYISVDKYDYDNTMLMNTGGSNFQDVTASTGTNIFIDAMSVSPGDYDNDGDEDIYITNSNEPPYNVFYVNNGDGTFTNLAASAGLLFQSTSWAANFFDFDNDTKLDLYVSSQSPLDYNGLFHNQGSFPFTQLSISGDNFMSFSNAIGDINNDGKMDIFTGGFGPFPCVLFENINPQNNNFIKINLQGLVSNREGLGSWIKVYANGETYTRFTRCGEGYLNQNSLTNHIGIGSATMIDSIKVTWLSGIVDKLYDVASNQTLSIIEGTTNIILPVELVRFEANARSTSVELHWETHSEEYLKGFELMRSEDGEIFSKIEFIDAAGSNISNFSYAFEDKDVIRGKTYYYQLQMVDLDNSFKLSPIVAATLQAQDDNHLSILINPIPSSQNYFELFSDQQQTVEIRVFSISGITVINYPEFDLQKGQNKVSLNKNLPPGIYIVSLQNSARLLENLRLAIF
ncbi:MAG: FG-GAP-like repeat-containing protein [Bacteroidota bacterium]